MYYLSINVRISVKFKMMKYDDLLWMHKSAVQLFWGRLILIFYNINSSIFQTERQFLKRLAKNKK